MCRRSLGTWLLFSPRRSVRGENFVRSLQGWKEGDVHVEVFKVLVLDRIQQRLVPGSLPIQFLRFVGKVVEVSKVLSQYRIQQRLWSISLTFHLVKFRTDHVFMVVGCGNDASQCQYWIVRYSWGELLRLGYVACCLALSMLRVSVRGLLCQIYQGTDHVISVICCGKDACLGQFGSGATLGENIAAVGLRSRGVWRSQC